MTKKYLIYTYDYNESIGGIIVLHLLCHLLNNLGAKAFLYRESKFELANKICNIWLDFILRRFSKRNKIGYRKTKKLVNNKITQWKVKRNVNFNTPFYDGKVTSDFIVVYPEVVDFNPYKARNVVRWLLHKPGYHTGRVNFGNKDLIFFYHDFFNDLCLNPFKHELNIIYINRVTYFQYNFGQRLGTCYAIRKGKNKNFVHEEDAILIDNMNQNEIAETFNRCKTFISYDTYSFYSQLAVFCGCESIVIPDETKTKEEWLGDKIELGYGIAYGSNDLDYARKTKHLLFDYWAEVEKKSIDSVRNFIKICQEYFKN